MATAAAAGGPTARRKQKAEPLAISPGLSSHKIDEEDISSGPNPDSLGDPSLLNDRNGRNLANVFPFVGGERGGNARKNLNTLQSCVKTFLLSLENHSQNVPLTTLKLQYDAICPPAILKPGRNVFTLLCTSPRPRPQIPNNVDFN